MNEPRHLDDYSSLPDRIGIDANGFGWRAWNDEDHLSMVPTNPDNSPIPQPMTWYVPALTRENVEPVVQEAIDEWAAIAGGPHNDRAERLSLARYIASKLAGPHKARSQSDD